MYLNLCVNAETVEVKRTRVVIETTKQEDSNKKSDVEEPKGAVVEGVILKENCKTETPEKELGQEDLSQPKYAYLPTPTTKKVIMSFNWLQKNVI